MISIHAPRTGSDRAFCAKGRGGAISIHAPRTGSDRLIIGSPTDERQFQSTLPARGATLLDQKSAGWSTFQSTLPARGATRHGDGARVPRHISIHAPRTGSDNQAAGIAPQNGDFNPRSPHGERPFLCVSDKSQNLISIHAPRTGSDRTYEVKPELDHYISIHAPRTGSDLIAGVPCADFEISIHAPRTGSDRGHLRVHRNAGGFQSTLPARGATDGRRRTSAAAKDFNPRSPHGERRV